MSSAEPYSPSTFSPDEDLDVSPARTLPTATASDSKSMQTAPQTGDGDPNNNNNCCVKSSDAATAAAKVNYVKGRLIRTTSLAFIFALILF